MDSLDLFEIVMAFEEAYGIEDPVRRSGGTDNGGQRYELPEREKAGRVKQNGGRERWIHRSTELLGIRYPILQGGMAWVAEHHLAAAVSAAGGFGILGRQRLRRRLSGRKSTGCGS